LREERGIVFKNRIANRPITRIGLIGIRQIMMRKISADPDRKKFSAITIVIEKLIRINHDPVFKFQSNPD
jgi:hypothetical protein